MKYKILAVLVSLTQIGAQRGDYMVFGDIALHARKTMNFYNGRVIGIVPPGLVAEILHVRRLGSGNYGIKVQSPLFNNGNPFYVYDFKRRSDDHALCLEAVQTAQGYRCQKSARSRTISRAMKKHRTRFLEAQTPAPAFGTPVGRPNEEPSEEPPPRPLKPQRAEAATTQATTCAHSCKGGKPAPRPTAAASSPESEATPTRSLLKKYKEAMKAFKKKVGKIRHPSIAHSQTRDRLKKTLVRTLIETMGCDDGSKALATLTAWGEARGSQAPQWHSNIAEMAIVRKNIENRVSDARRIRGTDPWFENSNLCKQTAEAADRFNRILAPWQYSVWNPSDHNQDDIYIDALQENVEPSLKRAFEMHELYERGQIKFPKALENGQSRHYASKRWVDRTRRRGWFKRRRLRNPRVTITKDGKKYTTTIKTHYIYPF